MTTTSRTSGRRRPLTRLAIAVAASAFLSAGARAQVPDADVDRIFADLAAPGSPGCALAVARDGRILVERGYGLENLDYDRPIRPSTVFNIGSTSKQFAAAAIVLLAEQGALSLDDDVRRWIPELPDYGATVTIRHMLHHTSGLRDLLGLMSLKGIRYYDILPPDEALAIIAAQRELNFTPGEEYLYSNTGYVLLGMIVERASGRSLRAFTTASLFEPLGMRDTHFHDDAAMIVKNRALAYRPGPEGGFELDFSTNFDRVGSGGLNTTARDLVLWHEALYAGRVGGPRFAETMHRRGTLNDGRTIDYALGLQHGEHRGLRTVAHGGSSLGFRAHLVRFPEQRLTVACLCNLSNADPGGRALRVAELFLAGQLAAAAEAPARTPSAATRGAVAPPPAGELADYAGAYESAELGVTFVLRMKAGQLLLARPAAAEAPVRFLERDRFAAPAGTLEFFRDPQGDVAGLRVQAGRVRGVRFERVGPR